ncbi:uridine kinase [Williamsoniiplasma luminosum]|uniref:Uridine kinase n=1 Tax=Williamsoniiplasma luminosum TaxID=214888 RepID=A0A2K8NU32_9MOLU|nr:uridine kinase [Williamsoniiplasma luminosum]ATZ17309.1 uridine kinase [Williamsoniiplasma luminosum]AVP49114.1 MAG: uridine kinase [Williamsoniiplasma luminosum]
MNHKPVFLIIIAGGTASGKTSVATKIANQILKDKSVSYLSMDNYYKDFSNLTLQEKQNLNFDHPNSFDVDLLCKDLIKLKNRQAIKLPQYNFVTHSREKEWTEFAPADVIILDGILALQIQEIMKLGDLKIFIKTSDDIRLIRRLERDIKERGRTFDNVIEQYLTTVKPMHDVFVEPSINQADIIIPFHDGNEIAIDLVATKVREILAK